MKTLVVYASHLGSTEGIATRIAETLRQHGVDATLQPAARTAEVAAYDGVIVGGGVYAGHWHPEAVAFVEQNEFELARRPVWLFGSGPIGDTAAKAEAEETKDVLSLAARVGARGHRMFAGSFDRSMVDDSGFDFFTRQIAKRFIPEGDWRDWPEIEAWATSIATELKPAVADPMTAGVA